MSARASRVILVGLVALALSGSCRRQTADDYVAGLPDLPADIAATLDPATMATKIPPATDITSPAPPADKVPGTAAAPCCSSIDRKSLTVNYSYTKCGPLRDFIVAPVGEFAVLNAKRETTKIYRLRSFSGKTVLDMQVCVTSQGPWNASLIETRACNGYAPVHTLTISAYGDVIPFVWSGGIENHPPAIGLVSCRALSVSRANCGISSCTCTSSSCPASDPCSCNLPW